MKKYLWYMIRIFIPGKKINNNDGKRINIPQIFSIYFIFNVFF